MRPSVVGLFLVLFCIGCHSTPPPQQEEATYSVRGVVVSSDASKGEVTIDAEEIPGFMGAMIMPYKLAQPGVATELHPGDRLTARLRVGDKTLLDQIVVVAQAKPDYKPGRIYNAPKQGQEIPDFQFTNQDGKTIHLAQFRGKALLVTFIYTRCPLPDYCIRMSRNLADVQKQLADDPKLQNQTHLLSISFDPAYDTPKVLRSYGITYAGRGAFARWDFAVPSAADLEAVDHFFDVGVTPGDNKTLNHSLSTIVIGPDGKVFRWYPSNDWTPETAVNDLKESVIAQPHP